MNIDRRLFLLSLTVPLYAAAPLKTFSKSEARLVEAIIDQIVPADDTPGAKEAGVLYYLDQQLAGPLKRFAGNYTEGLARFEAAGFVDLGYQARTEYLVKLETTGDAFFRLITEHTMQGFYGSPMHGGNRDEASWKMLGIEAVMGGHVH